MKKFAGLIIMDGLGLAKPSDSNAVTLAKTPYLEHLFKTYPHSTLVASGEAVGLPEGQMGNSEVGHLNLGAGRVVYQSLTRINVSIKDGSFFKNEAFLKAIEHVKKNNSKLHILGLVSNGGVHAYTTHIKALYDLAKQQGVSDKTYLHAFTDGRDTPQTSGLGYVTDLVNHGLKVATVSGRYYAMDRDNNWERLQKAYDTMVLGTGPKFKTAIEGIQDAYDNNLTDEFVNPFVVDENGLISDNDAVIFANFRPDRAIRIATAISNPEDTKLYHAEGKADFKFDKPLHNIFFVSMMHYNASVKGVLAYPLQDLKNIYGEVIANNGLRQFRSAETEKYAHVTFFFDGGREIELKGADRILVESPKVATYDLKPEMSAYEVKDKAVKAILSKQYDTMILNFANPDMVGHTGSIPATVKAVETTDACVKEVVEAILSIGGVAIILADHGNAEQMRDALGNPHTAHTTNLVPVIVTDKNVTVHEGALCDVAPTLLDFLGIDKPVEMTGKSLVTRK
ncbi:2,3-bisphosphoglycerate-independent phosphoglycerate mutase [Alteracholeplasma palmae J233]|uniref:2,3-bisphosphoglycerate-independent phosphoglycerate mutase n=1 Tax=Alteracholeplasma palmae (strain ATCC 49389 / J233) TaxID=1318466 RepID=U4KLA7_ALTPJ|nr:2,3-bisphosphoglycerate-independent phosphoglycerate mutase [Alteracholeplasma palmae]CCV64582.1 2,3-bisphosphoglycerate-independent phosphoglycerate mutase [Alteracholeplasma palmae J233]